MLGEASSTARTRVNTEELEDTFDIYHHMMRLIVRPPVTYHRRRRRSY